MFSAPALEASEPLDLQAQLIRDPASTFVVRVSGGAMEGAGISDGDRVLVERGRRPQDGDVVIAAVDGQFLIRRLHLSASSVMLAAEDPTCPPLHASALSELSIWGVVYLSLHRV